MTLILLATSIAGVLASKGLLAIGLHNVMIRYPITVLFAYGVFFAAIKIWLWLMTDAPVSKSRDNGINSLDLINISLPSTGSSEATFSGGGGSFDGGGASADFGDTLGEMGSGTGDVFGALVTQLVERLTMKEVWCWLLYLDFWPFCSSRYLVPGYS